ncbi:MAG: AAA family ATPase [Anaerolineae bacterium]
MLTRIIVQGFKSLQNVQIELGQVNVFIGANGSGKTNLLEAVGFLSASVRHSCVDDQELLRRGIRLGVASLYRSQDTENWTFAALFPDDDLCARDDYECTQIGRERPGYRLTLKKYGKLLRRTDGRIKKPRRQYERATPQIAAAWDTVRQICTQAERFTQDVLDYVKLLRRTYDQTYETRWPPLGSHRPRGQTVRRR